MGDPNIYEELNQHPSRPATGARAGVVVFGHRPSSTRMRSWVAVIALIPSRPCVLLVRLIRVLSNLNGGK